MMKKGFIFDDFFSQAESQIEKCLRDYWITVDKYIINKDNSIDVIGDVNFATNVCSFTELPLDFNKVSGDFDCSSLNLKSLKGSPKEVGGNFNCSYNKLEDLQFAPKRVGGSFVIDNRVQSLYANGVDLYYGNVKFISSTNIPELIKLPKIILYNIKHMRLILKYQHLYDVWRTDKSFNEHMFGELLYDIEDGLL